MKKKEIKYPKELEKIYEEALDAFESGNYTKAKVKFEEAIKYHEKNNIPYNIDALKILSHIYLLLNENEKAKYLISLILKITPDDINQVFKLAIALAQNEQYQEAVDILERLLEELKNKKNVEKTTLASLYNVLGTIYYHNHNYQKAKQCFKEALTYNPDAKTIKENLKFINNFEKRGN